MNFELPLMVTSLEQAITTLFDEEARIVGREKVYGGDINDACRLTLNNGASLFIKTNSLDRLLMFNAEAAGLAAMRMTNAIGVPEVLCTGKDNALGVSFLMMEYIESNSPVANYWEMLGKELAAMHSAVTTDFVSGGLYGFDTDNYIGSSEQGNPAKESWVDFFRTYRIEPQIARARHYFTPRQMREIDRLLERMDEFLTEPESPSLLHGDLWSGNVIRGRDGKAWLIDPAVYVGHAEADIAMTELFGGFHRRFYDSYRESRPLQPGYENRRDLYNLYHMLNHLNLFGRSYLGPVVRIIEKYA